METDSSRPLGEFMKERRTLQHLTLREAAHRLKISERQLQAIEEEDFSAFSAHVYARGIFSKYAEFLRIPLADTLPYFERIWSSQQSQPEAHPVRPIAKMPVLTLTPAIRRAIAFSAGAIGLVAILWGGYAFYSSRAPAFSLTEPADNILVHDYMIAIKGVSDPRLELTLNKVPVYIGKDGVFEKTILLQRGVNILELEGKNGFGNVTREIRHIVVD